MDILAFLRDFSQGGSALNKQIHNTLANEQKPGWDYED